MKRVEELSSRCWKFFTTSVDDFRSRLGIVTADRFTDADAAVESVQSVDQFLVGQSTQLVLRFLVLLFVVIDAPDEVVQFVHQLVVVDGVEGTNHGAGNHFALKKITIRVQSAVRPGMAKILNYGAILAKNLSLNGKIFYPISFLKKKQNLVYPNFFPAILGGSLSQD